MSATTKVLRIPELLEHILLQLPPKNVLLAHRVSKRWRKVIKKSPKLQRMLYFKPSTDKFLKYCHKYSASEYLFHNLARIHAY